MNRWFTAALAAAALTTLTACESLPGTRQQQGAVIGGAAGAVGGRAVTGGAVGTAVGAGVGAAAGSEIGRRQDDDRR
jgi:Glycine zipper